MCVAAGLIIDAFGELRDQQEQVKEDMEVRVQQQTSRALHVLKQAQSAKKGKYAKQRAVLILYPQSLKILQEWWLCSI